ncbi:MAG: 50S ribosomal protein L13 [Candidatus Dadabacteria bacterium]|nr:50S ribosomal protein L13 [Candidatus Dadabacteria bacterium]NIQ14547.1 50S ribosomal protein L13 [Candidatus Dadabacteria bacterium]
MKSFMAKNEEMQKKWYLIDAQGQTVGRIATRIATILRGKDKPYFTPHSDNGDFVVVVNADKVRFTGKKLNQKKYYWHTGYPGGIKSITADELLEKKPEEILTKAVWGMLPKNKWQKKLIQRLKVYTNDAHPHTAQKPEILEV